MKAPVPRTSSAAPPLVFRALMYRRPPGRRPGRLEKYKPAEAALPLFEVLCQQHRYDEAFPYWTGASANGRRPAGSGTRPNSASTTSGAKRTSSARRSPPWPPTTA